MSRRVVVTGMGAVSALGASVAELWDGVVAGRSGVRGLERMTGAGVRVTTGGEVTAVSHDVADRDERMARMAMDSALAQAGRAARDTGLVWGTGLDTFQTTAAGSVLRTAGACFATLAARHGRPRRMVAMACATGTWAIGHGWELVRSGRVEACVTGGSSVMLTPFYLTGFAALGALAPDAENGPAVCRPFDRGRRGLVLADGAGALVLESLDAAERRGATPLVEIIGFGTAADAFDLNRPPEDGAGALRCMNAALASAGLGPEHIDAVNAHATGTFAGDVAEAAALRALFGERWPEVPVSGVKGAIGHAMAAAGALEAVIAAHTCLTGVVPPTIHLREPDEPCRLGHVIGRALRCDAARVLSVSFAMGGQNAAILLQRMTS